MTWYPSGSGSGETEGDANTAVVPRRGETVITREDELPTQLHQALTRRPQPGHDQDEVDDDELTVARLGLSERRAPLGHAPGEASVDDDDPTIKRKALRRRTPPREELLDHRYQLIKQVGAGGMGEVWKARHVQLGRDVAIKFLTNEAGGPRFRLEAQAIATVRHTGVVDVLDFGETSQGVPYFVMELLEGQTLSKRVRKTGPLSWALVRNIALELADALAHAHTHGVVHRDLKPSNVIVLDSPLQRGSSTKLIDFGIAKLLDAKAVKLTEAGFVQGTPAYMSPEQVLGEDIDERADVYGLGCLLYYLLSAQRPFPDKSGAAALRAQLYELPPRFAEVVPDQSIPPEVEALVFRAIAKDKQARFESMRAMHDAVFEIPPDASASMSRPASAYKLESADSHAQLTERSASVSLPMTDSYGAPSGSYADVHPSSSAASDSGAAASSAVSASPASSGGDTVKIVLAVIGSLTLVAAAITGLIWALTS